MRRFKRHVQAVYYGDIFFCCLFCFLQYIGFKTTNDCVKRVHFLVILFVFTENI